MSSINVPEETAPQADLLKGYIAYRRAELESEERNIANAGYSGIGGGAMISRGERLRMVMTMLEELDKLAAWLEAGRPVYVPPLSTSDRQQWQWAKDHGLPVPPHIEEQL